MGTCGKGIAANFGGDRAYQSGASMPAIADEVRQDQEWKRG